MRQSGWNILTAETADGARQLARRETADAALLDYALPDGNGLELALELRQQYPDVQVVLMTGGSLSSEEEAVCKTWRFPILQKPFLPADVMELIRGSLQKTRTAGA